MKIICEYDFFVLKGMIQKVVISEKVWHVAKKGNRSSTMKILFLANSDAGLYQFRRELVKEVLKNNKVCICSPRGMFIEEFLAMGCLFIGCDCLDRRGVNPLKEIRLFRFYYILLKKLKPDMVFTYTIKPNIYGGMACARLGIPYVTNITGLGTAVENGGPMQKLTLTLYSLGLKKAQKVFFQNKENMNFMIKRGIISGDYAVLPGSGVNLEKFSLQEYPGEKQVIRFVFISRIMKEKGIDYFLAAAKVMKQEYPNIEFHVCGTCEKDYKGNLKDYHEKGTVIYHGEVKDIQRILKKMHCVVHPTYYPEGMSNVLLEACASGRPIITTDRSGCREIVEDGINGYMIPTKDEKALIEALRKFMKLSWDERKRMGEAARRKVEKEFDRKKVVEAYMAEMERLNTLI